MGAGDAQGLTGTPGEENEHRTKRGVWEVGLAEDQGGRHDGIICAFVSHPL